MLLQFAGRFQDLGDLRFNSFVRKTNEKGEEFFEYKWKPKKTARKTRIERTVHVEADLVDRIKKL